MAENAKRSVVIVNLPHLRIGVFFFFFPSSSMCISHIRRMFGMLQVNLVCTRGRAVYYWRVAGQFALYLSGICCISWFSRILLAGLLGPDGWRLCVGVQTQVRLSSELWRRTGRPPTASLFPGSNLSQQRCPSSTTRSNIMRRYGPCRSQITTFIFVLQKTGIMYQKFCINKMVLQFTASVDYDLIFIPNRRFQNLQQK